MKVSVIGCGKMGKEILDILMESDVDIVWLGRNPEKQAEYETFLTKKLKRLGRRKDWSKVEVEYRKKQIQVSFEEKGLAGSDFVIETVVEDLNVKQALFQRVERVVGSECIFLSNTSSLPLEQVFEKVEAKSRCAGFHFFFPCKIIDWVEINCFEKTDTETVDKTRKLAEYVDRKYIVLGKEADMLFSKMILTLMSEAYNIYSEGVLGSEEINQLTIENFMMMGIFDILNSTGNAIVYNCVCNLVERVNESFYEKFKNQIFEIHDHYKDCTFHEFVSAKKNAQGTEDESRHVKMSLKQLNVEEKEAYVKHVRLRFQCLYINYATYVVEKLHVGKEEFVEACKHILGITKEPGELLAELGVAKVTEVLAENYDRIPCEVYEKQDLTIWNR